MTVQELLERIVEMYQAAPEALASFKPVFYARLKRHEGEKLEAAANEVFGSFKAKFDQKFPIPIDFETQIPKNQMASDGGAPIRDRMTARGPRKASLMAAWWGTQGTKIRDARGPIVAQACAWEAERIAGVHSWSDTPERVVLNAAQVDVCERRAVSQARIAAFGARVLNVGTNEQWDDQTADVRDRIFAGEYPARIGETAAEVRQSQRVTDRLAALAKARRTGRPVDEAEDDIRAPTPHLFAEVRDVPEVAHV